MNVREIGLQSVVNSDEITTRMGVDNAAALRDYIYSQKFDGAIYFPKGYWPLTYLQLTQALEGVVLSGAGAILAKVGDLPPELQMAKLPTWISVSSRKTVVRDLVFDAKTDKSVGVLGINDSKSLIIDGITTIGGRHGVELQQANFDVHIRDCSVYGASNVGIYVGSYFGEVEGANGNQSNVEIFITNTRVHGCKQPECDENDTDRTKYGLLVEAATSGLYVTGLSVAWASDIGIAVNAIYEKFPAQYLFFSKTLSDSIFPNQNGVGLGVDWYLNRLQDAYLIDCWAGYCHDSGIVIGQVGNPTEGVMMNGSIQIVSTKVYNTGHRNDGKEPSAIEIRGSKVFQNVQPTLIFSNNIFNINKKNQIYIAKPNHFIINGETIKSNIVPAYLNGITYTVLPSPLRR